MQRHDTHHSLRVDEQQLVSSLSQANVGRTQPEDDRQFDTEEGEGHRLLVSADADRRVRSMQADSVLRQPDWECGSEDSSRSGINEVGFTHDDEVHNPHVSGRDVRRYERMQCSSPSASESEGEELNSPVSDWRSCSTETSNNGVRLAHTGEDGGVPRGVQHVELIMHDYALSLADLFHAFQSEDFEALDIAIGDARARCCFTASYIVWRPDMWRQIFSCGGPNREDGMLQLICDSKFHDNAIIATDSERGYGPSAYFGRDFHDGSRRWTCMRDEEILYYRSSTDQGTVFGDNLYVREQFWATLRQFANVVNRDFESDHDVFARRTFSIAITEYERDDQRNVRRW